MSEALSVGPYFDKVCARSAQWHQHTGRGYVRGHARWQLGACTWRTLARAAWVRWRADALACWRACASARGALVCRHATRRVAGTLAHCLQLCMLAFGAWHIGALVRWLACWHVGMLARARVGVWVRWREEERWGECTQCRPAPKKMTVSLRATLLLTKHPSARISISNSTSDRSVAVQVACCMHRCP